MAEEAADGDGCENDGRECTVEKVASSYLPYSPREMSLGGGYGC